MGTFFEDPTLTVAQFVNRWPADASPCQVATSVSSLTMRIVDVFEHPYFRLNTPATTSQRRHGTQQRIDSGPVRILSTASDSTETPLGFGSTVAIHAIGRLVSYPRGKGQ